MAFLLKYVTMQFYQTYAGNLKELSTKHKPLECSNSKILA